MNQEQAKAYDFTAQATGLAPEDVVTMAHGMTSILK